MDPSGVFGSAGQVADAKPGEDQQQHEGDDQFGVIFQHRSSGVVLEIERCLNLVKLSLLSRPPKLQEACNP